MIKSVAGIVYIKNKYLFQIRDKKPSIQFSGFNGFFGGLVDKGETPNQAIKREILEELNVSITKSELLINLNFQTKKLKEKRDRYYYILNLKKNFEKKLIISEGAGFKFFSIDQIKLSNMIPWDITAIYYHQLLIKKKEFRPK